jgi:translation initiation factor IF-3
MTAPPSKDGPRVNEDITSQQVRLIDADGGQVGVVHIREALEMSEEVGLDLVEISPTAEPPVCKIMDYGKFKFETQKRKAEQRKKTKVIEIKEIKLRPNIDDNDYNIKMRNLKRFIEEGNKVKVTLRFRGRELAHQDLGIALLNRVREQFVELVKVEQFPKMEGRQMTMVMAPR